MTNQTWLNLPVKNAARSKEFFAKLDAQFVENETPTMFGIYLGLNKVQVMMFEYPEFEQFTQSKVADLSTSAEILISMEAQSMQEVDVMTQKIRNAGGTIFAEPTTWQGWMYGMGFQDPDGHRWNVAFMDWDKMPRK